MNANPHPSTAPVARHRILVVDDNPSIHSDFQKILRPRPGADGDLERWEGILFEDVRPVRERVQFDLDSAHQGEEALELVKEALAENHPYALAFVDVRMPPGWDGIETISRLWEVHPRLQVVICTAYSDYSWDEMRARLGRPDNLVVLKKPFDNVEVQQLAHVLTRKWELNFQAEMKLEQLEAMVRRRTAELEQAHDNLARSEERFAKAFLISPVAMGIQSLPDQRFVDVNQGMVRLTGHARPALVGHCAEDLNLWAAPAQAQTWYEGLAAGQTIREREAEVRDLAGNLHQVLLSLSAVTLDGRPHALLAVQDVTERTRLEQQLRQAQKMEAVGQLAAGIAHDFNNILTVIQAHAELMTARLEPDRPELKSVREIAKASERAADLIRQLLAFGRKQVMQFQELDLSEAVNGALGMVRRLVGEHIRLAFTPAPRLPLVKADPTMIEQVVLNLAVNARDAMPQGGEVRITTEAITVQRAAVPMDPQERDGAFVRLTFTDTGCGMDNATLQRIFEPFFTTKAVGAGTGLGLSTVFGIVRQHGGWIEVDSALGEGTTLRLFFPVSSTPTVPAAEAQPAAAPIVPSEPPVTAAPAGPDLAKALRGHETILVAEDEDALREMVSMVLTHQGYTVLVATSGVEALEVYDSASCPIDLLLTDIVMPGGILGGELARRLRAINPLLKVIFTSGYRPGMPGVDGTLDEGRDFLPKPYTMARLTQLVREALDRPLGDVPPNHRN
ncbi:MAG: response regulator [Verrucomicrobia bacterium]|nr:response regulator [Verrucomicrobiota bacterium]